jgi:hypothetical protein
MKGNEKSLLVRATKLDTPSGGKLLPRLHYQSNEILIRCRLIATSTSTLLQFHRDLHLLASHHQSEPSLRSDRHPVAHVFNNSAARFMFASEDFYAALRRQLMI